MKRLFNLTMILALCVSGIASGGNNEDKGKQAYQEKFEEATRLVKKAKWMVIDSECTDILLWEANSFVEHVNGVLDSEEHSITDGLFEKRDYKVIYVDDNIASFHLEKTSYTGGAHPDAWRTAWRDAGAGCGLFRIFRGFRGNFYRTAV